MILLLCHNDVITIKICGFYKTSLIKNKKEKGVSDLKKDKKFKGIEYYRTKQVFFNERSLIKPHISS